MRGWRKAGTVLLGVLTLGAAPPELADQRRRLLAAKAAAAAAAVRSATLDQAAAGERDAAGRARAQEAAVAARIDRAQADIAAARARVALVAHLLGDQRARLAERQAPVARLLAALQSLASRPAVVAIVQPGSVDDLVHVRAVLGGALPVIRARTADLRADLAQTRALQADAVLAARALGESRARLDTQRQALAALEARHQMRSVALGRGALIESDRAMAMGERARDIVDQMAATGTGQATEAELAALPGPPAPSAIAPALPPAYRLPAEGRLVTGLGEISDAGFRSRGLTLAVAAGAPVVAPASGRVTYARAFRDYGTIVIIDHGAGWTTLVAGLSTASVAAGRDVLAGAPLGRAATGDDPRLTVELRRRGRPVDITALL